MFSPRGVAFVGATETLGKWGFIIFNNLITGGWEGGLYPVNPGREEVLGYKAYKSVRDVPDDTDLAVITVPAKAVPAAMDDCIARGVKAVVVISAGFKEMGGDAARTEADMVKKVRDAGIVMAGPNGQGVAFPKSGLYAWMPHFYYPPAGEVAVISQSGNVQGLMINELIDAGVGVSRCVSSGNEADLRMRDYFEYLADDPETGVVLSYMEGLTDGRRFIESAKRLAAKKPVVVLKGGKSDYGVSAAGSHTGALAVDSELFDSACEQAGVIQASTIREASIMAASFVNRPLPKGRRVGIVTGGGGLGVIASDLCARAGLTLPEFSKETTEKIAAKMPEWYVPGNPVDLVAGLNFGIVPPILDTLMKSGEIDALMLLFIGPRGNRDIEPKNEQTKKMRETWQTMQKMFGAFLDMMRKLTEQTGVPIYPVTNFGEGTGEMEKIKFSDSYFMQFSDIESACSAVAAAAKRAELLKKIG